MSPQKDTCCYLLGRRSRSPGVEGAMGRGGI